MNVRLVEYTPNPDRVCGMASRTCISNTPFLDDQFSDLNFERSLEHALASGHESVAEHASFTFYISGISRACSHQLVRHRMASYAQQSQRYVKIDEIEMVIPETIKDAIKTDLLNGGGWNRDGSLKDTLDTWKHFMQKSARMLREQGVPEEDIRYLYPNACCTNITVTMNGRELRHFFALRCCNRAQWEIRELATEMLKLVKPVAPILFEDAGPNCINGTGCKELKPCGEPVAFGAHTVKKEE